MSPSHTATRSQYLAYMLTNAVRTSFELCELPANASRKLTNGSLTLVCPPRTTQPARRRQGRLRRQGGLKHTGDDHEEEDDDLEDAEGLHKEAVSNLCARLIGEMALTFMR